MVLRGTVVAAVVAVAAASLAACGGDDTDQAQELATVLASVTDEPDGEDEPAVIAVQGHGTANGRPDLLTVNLGVETHGVTAAEALDDNNQRTSNAIAVLEDNGVKPADRQTSDLSVRPDYDDDGQVVGYTVNSTVTARLRDLDRAGPMIDAVAFGTGNAIRLRGLWFSIDDDTELLAEAREQAVQRAIAQATQLTDAAGVNLGPVQSIDETNGSFSHLGREEASLDAAAESFSSTPIEAGSQEVSVDVTMVYEISE